MRVRFDKEDKKYFSMAEAPIVNAIIKDMKTSEDSLENAVEYAMIALDIYDVIHIFETDAKISHNCRVWNYYNDNSETIDIWVNATVSTNDTFYIIGFYLSDAWSVDDKNHAEIASHITVRKFVETE